MSAVLAMQNAVDRLRELGYRAERMDGSPEVRVAIMAEGVKEATNEVVARNHRRLFAA